MLRLDQLVVVACIIIGAAMMGAGFMAGARYSAVPGGAFVYVIDRYNAEIAAICSAGACERR